MEIVVVRLRTGSTITFRSVQTQAQARRCILHQSALLRVNRQCRRRVERRQPWWVRILAYATHHKPRRSPPSDRWSSRFRLPPWPLESGYAQPRAAFHFPPLHPQLSNGIAGSVPSGWRLAGLPAAFGSSAASRNASRIRLPFSPGLGRVRRNAQNQKDAIPFGRDALDRNPSGGLVQGQLHSFLEPRRHEEFDRRRSAAPQLHRLVEGAPARSTRPSPSTRIIHASPPPGDDRRNACSISSAGIAERVTCGHSMIARPVSWIGKGQTHRPAPSASPAPCPVRRHRRAAQQKVRRRCFAGSARSRPRSRPAVSRAPQSASSRRAQIHARWHHAQFEIRRGWLIRSR